MGDDSGLLFWATLYTERLCSVCRLLCPGQRSACV